MPLLRRSGQALIPVVLGVALAGCAPKQVSTGDSLTASMDRHRQAYGDFEPPRKIGSVPNLGLQLPQISPDGTQMVYLRTDRDAVSPMTIFGSDDPSVTPTEGTLSIWLRPVEGASLGRRVSRERWAHSPVWSNSGEFLAYVAGETGGTVIVRVNVSSGQADVLGAGPGVSCLPVFDGDDNTLLFCRGDSAADPFTVCRQAVGESQPQTLTPKGMDCLLPVRYENGNVICARTEGQHLDWVECSPATARELVPKCGGSQRPGVLQVMAGIPQPLAPDRKNFVFYDQNRDRVGVCQIGARTVRLHRAGSIAACWLGNDTLALATSEGLFAVNATSGVSLPLLSGSWLPMRYVPAAAKLYLLGKDNGTSRLAIYELVFRPAAGQPDKGP